MNNEEIKDLIKLVSKLGLGKVEIEKDGFKINIKGPNMVPSGIYMAPPVAAPITNNTPSPAPVASEPVVSTPTESSSTITIKSSMIGTFYRSSSPDKPPFAEVGSEIKKGDKICIIEAMKILNEIESDKAGTVKQVLCENGQAVEYGQALYTIE